MREEDITEIVTEEEAKAGGGFFRTSRGALRCARCRSCLNRQMKRRCDMIITSSSTGATPKPKRAHASSKPDANDANAADADGDDAPHKAFAVWQRRTLFAVGGGDDDGEGTKFPWRRVTTQKGSRSKIPNAIENEPAVRTYGRQKPTQGTGGDPDMVSTLADAENKGVAVVAPAPDLHPLGGFRGGAESLRLARAVMAGLEGRPAPTVASFTEDVDDASGGVRPKPRYSTLKCGVCAGCRGSRRAHQNAKDVALRACENYPADHAEPANDAARKREREARGGDGGVKRLREEAATAAALNPKPGLNAGGAGLLFVCDAPGCGKRFAEKRSLAKHVKTHDTDRPYKCLFAGCESMGFLDSSKLKRHWLTHPGCGHLIHMCPYPKCGQAFAAAAERASHMGEHTEEKYYFCWHVSCNKRFNSREAQETHTRDVHDNQIGGEE